MMQWLIYILPILAFICFRYSFKKTPISTAFQNDISKHEHRLLMAIERNKQVYAFRYRMAIIFGINSFEIMPDYLIMCESDLPLTAKNWLRVDELFTREVAGDITDVIEAEGTVLVVNIYSEN